MKTVYLKTTDTCNLNCSHCFTGGNRPPRYFWNIEKTKKWVADFMRHIGNEDVHFEFHGGEPMLAPIEQLCEMRDFLRSFGEQASIGITTNLVYKLKDEHIEFFKSLDGFGTSWDPDIRFDNEKQYKLWFDNTQRMIPHAPGNGLILNVSVSKKVTQMDQKDLIKFLASTGAAKVLFDRITLNGNAEQNTHLFPTNKEINDWYLNLHDAAVALDSRSWFYLAALEDVYAKFENSNPSCGTFCRDCEERNFTVNADGTIGGCPNSAPDEYFGTIDDPIEKLFISAKRLDVMASERTRNAACFECSVFEWCGSDCHRLAWDGDICASPRQLMKKLAGQDYSYSAKPSRKVIPIYSAKT